MFNLVFFAAVSAFLNSLIGSCFDRRSKLRMFCNRRSIKSCLLSGNCSLRKRTKESVQAGVSFVATMFSERKLPKGGEAIKVSNFSRPESSKYVPWMFNFSKANGFPPVSSY